MTKSILIVGAGPTGMTAAIELSRRGIPCRIVDKKDRPSTLSRAVGINQRSLEILQKSSITQKLLEQGFKINGGVFHGMNDEILGQINFDKIKDQHNFLLALPQDQTEEIMRLHLAQNGINVEYGTEVINIVLKNQKAEIALSQDHQKTIEKFDLVIAADGAHSVIRQKLNIDFVGYDYENLWSIADFESLNFCYAKNSAHVFLRNNGKVGFIIRIGENRYRAVSNTESAIEALPSKIQVQEIHRAATFKVLVRQAATYQKGRVFLAGDAAHTHSPAGGRGMNLGIEDAYILAKLIKNDDLKNYTKYRHKIGKKVLRFSERLVFMATIKNGLGIFVRNLVLKIITKFSIMEKRLLK